MARKRKPGKGGGGAPKAPRKERSRAGLTEWIRSLAWAAVGFLFIRIFLLETYVIDSGSMEGTLLVGDFLAVNKLAIGPGIPFTDIRLPGYSEPRRGDILVFDPHHEEDMIIVKRVIGMPGDTVEMRDKVLYVNGERRDEPYVVTIGARDVHDPQMLWQREFLVGGSMDDYRPTWDSWGPLAIPADRYLMLGDNRDDSIDSRLWGFLEGWRFRGRVALIYFSYDRDSFRPFPWITEVRGSRIGDRVR
ncbi:MAG: signal peptidase I [Gemmatimonadetes bacterium]|nr:signal peptidase I [Gemmatimonadota bacterium]